MSLNDAKTAAIDTEIKATMDADDDSSPPDVTNVRIISFEEYLAANQSDDDTADEELDDDDGTDELATADDADGQA